MSDNQNNNAPKTLVDTVFDLGTTWAEYGLSWGKFALESSAKALSRTADTLGDIAEKLKAEAPADQSTR